MVTIAFQPALARARAALESGRHADAIGILTQALKASGFKHEDELGLRCTLAEAWLMADASAARAFFRSAAIPSQPELEPRPKIALVQACRASKLRRIRDGIVPPPRSGGVVGPEYSLLINEYARDHWDVSRALQNAPSLARAVQRLETLVATQVW